MVSMWTISGDYRRGTRNLRRSELRALRRFINVYGGPNGFMQSLEETKFMVAATGTVFGQELVIQHNPWDGQYYLKRRFYDKGEETVAEECYPSYSAMISRIFGGR